MITEEEAARTAQRLQDALRAAADVIPVRDIVTNARPRRLNWGWFVPLTAAACVVALVAASVAIARSFSSTGDVQGPAAGPPEYYAYVGYGTHSAALEIQVRRTSTGQVTAVSPIAGYGLDPLALLSAAAGDRTFFTVAAQLIPTPHNRTASYSMGSRFYRLTITADGRISSFGPVGALLPSYPTTMSASPDGSRIAYTLPGTPGRGADQETGTIHVLEVASGVVRTWHNTVSAAVPARVASISGPLSWRSDNRTLIVDYAGTHGLYPANLAALALDTSSPGGSLQAHSRVLVSQAAHCTLCVTSVISGPGGTLTAAEYRQTGSRYLLEVLTLGGPRLLTVVRKTVVQKTAFPLPDQPQLSADASGKYVVVTQLTGTGWIKDGKLIPLAVEGATLRSVFAW